MPSHGLPLAHYSRAGGTLIILASWACAIPWHDHSLFPFDRLYGSFFDRVNFQTDFHAAKRKEKSKIKAFSKQQ
ncbi:hypothetical protein BC940DRAFT_10435 [Gongronella butleri]|nr:hypothetical protein BC940DRAFT_10435 [Gongronella butleri]